MEESVSVSEREKCRISEWEFGLDGLVVRAHIHTDARCDLGAWIMIIRLCLYPELDVVELDCMAHRELLHWTC